MKTPAMPAKGRAGRMNMKEGVEGFGPLFEPVRIAGLEIQNRIAMAPMRTGGLMDPEEVSRSAASIIIRKGRRAARASS